MKQTGHISAIRDPSANFLPVTTNYFHYNNKNPTGDCTRIQIATCSPEELHLGHENPRRSNGTLYPTL